MKPEILPFAPALPSDWQSILQGKKSPIPSHDALLAWVELDLAADLRFEKSLLGLCEEGLFWTDGKQFESWPLEQGQHLVHGDHAGVGHLRLETANTLLRAWYFTLAVNPQVLRLQSSFLQLTKGEEQSNGNSSEYDKQVCPACLSPKPANVDSCPT